MVSPINPAHPYATTNLGLHPSLVVALACLMVGATGCHTDRSKVSPGSDPSGTPPTIVTGTPAPVRFGEEAQNPYFRIRVLNWKPCAVEAHLELPPGLRKVSVEVELAAVGASDVPSNPFYAQLADKDGHLFESTLAGCPPLLEATRLRAGHSARGWITFDLPEGSVPHSLVYQPAVIGVAPPKVELLLSP